MTVPDPDMFRAMLANQGLSLTEDRIAQAVANHAAMRSDLEALRSVELAFVGDVIEPGTALQWIERGGVTQ
jgi:HD superfamily phosphohydrolase YqeK